MDEAEVVAIAGHAALLQALGQTAADQGFLAAVHLDARLAMDEALKVQKLFVRKMQRHGGLKP